MKLNGANQLLACADDGNILGGSVRTVKKNREAFLVGSKEIGLEVNAENGHVSRSECRMKSQYKDL